MKRNDDLESMSDQVNVYGIAGGGGGGGGGGRGGGVEGGGCCVREKPLVDCCFHLWEGSESGESGEGSTFSMDVNPIETEEPPIT